MVARVGRLVPVSLWRSSFMFLDETGTLHSARDRFFGVGGVKVPDPSALQRPLQALRQREHFFAEFKWNDLKLNVVPTYKAALDIFFARNDARFCAFVADKSIRDPIAEFGDQWRAYERLACQLLVGNIRPAEHMIVLADEYSTPANVDFEGNVRRCVNGRLGHKLVVGICRMRSTGVDIFQVLDVLLGAVVYDYKLHAGLIPGGGSTPKLDLLNHIKARIGVITFVGGIRRRRINIAERT